MAVEKRPFFARGRGRESAARFILEECPEGWSIVCSEPVRNLEQNARFHAMCGDIAKSGYPWAGKPRTLKQWKVLLVSAHAHATEEETEIVPGLEGEFVAIRESTALMSIRRTASLIDYTKHFGDSIGVVWSEPVKERPT